MRGESRARADERARKLVHTMQVAFEDATTTGWESLEHGFGLPDPDDEHVVAAAVVARADAIVTSNLRHFPSDRLPDGIEALPPAEFAFNTVAVDRVRARQAVQAISNRSGHVGDEWSVDEVMDRLEARYGMGHAVALMRERVIERTG